MQQMHSPDPQSRIHASAEGRSVLQSDPPHAPDGWVREIKQRKDSGRKDIVYRRPEGADPGQPSILRSTTEAARWLEANPSCGLTLDAFDFVSRKGDKVTASGGSDMAGDSNDESKQLDASADARAPAEASATSSSTSGGNKGGGGSSGKSGAFALQGEQGANKKPKKTPGAASEAPFTQSPNAEGSGAGVRRGAEQVGEGSRATSDKPSGGAGSAPKTAPPASAGASAGGVSAGGGGGERQKRERKQTSFYDPQKVEGDGVMHAVPSGADSPTAALAGRQMQAPKKPSGDSGGSDGGDTKAGKKRKVSVGGAAGRVDISEDQPVGGMTGRGAGSAEGGADEMSACAACDAAHRGVAQCFSQGHMFVKHDGSRPHSCASCRQRNKGALHCFKRGHMQGLLRAATKADAQALSQMPVAAPSEQSRSAADAAPDTAPAASAGAEAAKAGGKKNVAAAHAAAAAQVSRGAASVPAAAATPPGKAAGKAAEGQPACKSVAWAGADSEADAAALAEGAGRKGRLGRGSADRSVAGSYTSSSYTTTASHRSARPSFREHRDKEREREARERGLDMEQQHPVAQPITLWEEVIHRICRRCCSSYLRDKGQVEQLSSSAGEGGGGSREGMLPAKQLLSAAAYGDDEVAHRLIGEGVDVNARDELRHTALHHAAAAGNLALARLLLEAGADAAARGADGDDACHVAASQGHEEVCPPPLPSTPSHILPASVAPPVPLLVPLPASDMYEMAIGLAIYVHWLLQSLQLRRATGASSEAIRVMALADAAAPGGQGSQY